MISILKYFKTNWLVTLIVLVGIIIRFLPIGHYQYSHDELSALSRTEFTNLYDLLIQGVKLNDTHPALIQLFLWVWVKLVGTSETLVKLPFLICGILSVIYIFKFGKKHFSINTGVLASLIISCSFIFIIYSSYARMYVSGVLFSILLLNSVYTIAFGNHVKKSDYAQYVVFALLCAFNHHLSCLFAFIVTVLSFFYIPKQNFKPFIIACFVAALLYLPHISITLFQFGIGGIGTAVGGWLPPPRTNEILYFIKTLFGTGYTGVLVLLIYIGILCVSVFKLIAITKKQFLLLWIFCINYLIIHLYSVYKNPILQNSCLLFCGICLILFFCSFAGFISKKQITMLSFCIAFLLVFQSVVKKKLFTKVHVHDFESQAMLAKETITKFGVDSTACVFTGEPYFISLYEKKYNTAFNSISAYDTVYNSAQKFNAYVSQLKQPYIVVGALSPLQLFIIKDYYPYLVSHNEDYFRNMSVFSKHIYNNTDVSVLETKQLLNSDLQVTYNTKKPITFYGDSITINYNDKSGEYPLNLNLPINKANLSLGQFMIAELSFYCDSIETCDADKWCISIGENNKPSTYFSAMKLTESYSKHKNYYTARVSFFAGSELDTWKKNNMEINVFLWKGKKSTIRVYNCNLKKVDYNPSRWVIFK